MVILSVAVEFHFVSFSSVPVQQGAVQPAVPYGIRWKFVSGPKKTSDLLMAVISMAPVFFPHTVAWLAPTWPVAWMISMRLLRRSSARSAEDTRALPARLIAGIRAVITEPMAATAATVNRIVEIAFSMADLLVYATRTSGPGGGGRRASAAVCLRRRPEGSPQADGAPGDTRSP